MPSWRTACCSSTVEAVPAEPENEAAESTDRQRVTGDSVYLFDLAVLVLNILADTGTKDALRR